MSSLKLFNIYRKTPVLGGSLFSKVDQVDLFSKFDLFQKHLRTAASLSRLLGQVKVKKVTERSFQ